jgi:hypothetical protein
MEYLKNFLKGVGEVLVLDADPQYIRPSRKSFSNDLALLQGDARRIVADLNKVTKQNGKQTYIGESK